MRENIYIKLSSFICELRERVQEKTWKLLLLLTEPWREVRDEEGWDQGHQSRRWS